MHRRRQYLDAPTHARGTESVAGLGTHTTTCASRCIDVRRGDAVLGLPLAPRSKPVAPPDSADATLAHLGKESLLGALPVTIEPAPITRALLLVGVGPIGERPHGAPHFPELVWHSSNGF